MTRAEVMKHYRTDAHGRIISPGAFEGEMIYLPHYWEAFMDGMVDFERGDVLGFYIEDDERREFPELGKRRRTVKLYQRSDGFIIEV